MLVDACEGRRIFQLVNGSVSCIVVTSLLSRTTRTRLDFTRSLHFSLFDDWCQSVSGTLNIPNKAIRVFADLAKRMYLSPLSINMVTVNK